VRTEARSTPWPVADLDLDELELPPRFGVGAFAPDVSPRFALGIAAAMLVVFLVSLIVFWKKDITIEVQGHTWERKIAIERYVAEHDSGWQSSVPVDAYSVSCHTELKRTDKVPDGTPTCRSEPGACSTVDNGNGSGSVSCAPDRQVCDPQRYRDVPVYDERCSYTVDRWRHARFATASGSQLEPAPAWPTPKFEQCKIRHLGCERAGAQTAEYLVHFVSNEEPARAFECDYPQPKWSSFKPDSTWAARVGVLWRRLDCDSVRTQAAR
jgi:hypothetical protein